MQIQELATILNDLVTAGQGQYDILLAHNGYYDGGDWTERIEDITTIAKREAGKRDYVLSSD